MLWQPSLPERYLKMSDDDLSAAITARRKELGDRLLILGHHYQQDDVIQHADLTGDSLKLSQMAAEEAAKRGTKFIVFCGVHFMAETADILTPDDVAVMLPDLSAGCSMADMADYDDTVECWETLHAAHDGSKSTASRSRKRASGSVRIIPITYVNSSAAIKAFVGDHGGACCTSSNALEVFKWARAGGTQPKAADETIKVLFLPDQHLGRNTASKMGLVTELDVQREDASDDSESDTMLWNPRQDHGGTDDDRIRRSQVYLWAGHCSVHKLFRPEHVADARAKHPNITVLVHPECCKEVVDLADLQGSTEFIIRTIENAPPNSEWMVATEVHLVNRLAQRTKERGVIVHMLSDCQCLCTTMYRIDQPHLLWVLDHLAAGKVVNQIKVHPTVAVQARLALERMLAHVGRVPPKRQPVTID
jgi:quinolinate synthase